MSNRSIHPPGEKVKKALQEFALVLEDHPDKDRLTLFRQLAIKYDLSPRECDFFERHLQEKC